MMKKQSMACIIGGFWLLPLTGCSNVMDKQSEKVNIPDGAIVISGDLTYEKMKEALAPLMTNVVTQTEESGSAVASGSNIAIDQNFSSIDAGPLVKVIFHQNAQPSARIEIPERWKNHVKYSYSNGKIKVENRDHYSIVPRKVSEYIMLYVNAPRLLSLDLSGVSHADLGTLHQTEGLSIELSGASNVNIDDFESEKDLLAYISGASGMGIGRLRAQKVGLGLSGASKVALQGILSSALTADISGASKAKLSGEVGHLTFDASGASSVTASGKAGKALIDASGTSKIDVSNLQCQQVTEDLSGMSKIVR
ncbi:MAG: DUF2807 domain-containing protein [Bacteroidaceae bacterium]|nr:DUF2807 domain-containing protein [Bacteroidaceae bacterium]